MYDKESIIREFVKNLTYRNITTSTEYRNLGCRPSLETIRKYYGGWGSCVRE